MQVTSAGADQSISWRSAVAEKAPELGVLIKSQPEQQKNTVFSKPMAEPSPRTEASRSIIPPVRDAFYVIGKGIPQLLIQAVRTARSRNDAPPPRAPEHAHSRSLTASCSNPMTL
ncbi:hypothetical protein GCM10010307_71780 [Streptomyces vastus]|uniref:Uncharacterized protein n=1 Tax=Streptomyces vastus TaxID=285451 RepID=A0ABN3RNX0_9ACTN